MFTLKRLFISSLLLLLIFNAVLAQEERIVNPFKEPSVVTASVSGERVRFASPSAVVQIRIEVYDSSGKKLFDNELRGGNILDWHVQDGRAERLAEGTYLCVVTAKSLSGKLTQKIGNLIVEAAGGRLQAVSADQFTAQQAQAVGPVEEDSALVILREDEPVTTTVIAHNGEEGQIIRGKGALSFRLGDFYSGNDREQMRLSEEGNLEVAGMVRASKGIIFPDGSIQFSASRKTFGAASLEPGQLGKGQKSGQEHFEIAAAGTGTQNFIAKWVETGGAGTLGNSIIFDNGTNVGIGTTMPAKRLDVRGGQIALDNSRFLYSRRSNGQFQEAFGIDSNDDIVFNRNSIVPGVDADAPKLPSALIFGTGAGRFMDIRNSLNQAMVRVWEATGNVGIGTSNPAAKLDVAGAINTSTQYNIGGSRVLSVAGTSNLFAGVNAGQSNTMGNFNSFFGANAGFSNTTGSLNSFFGSSAGINNTTGPDNSFFGAGAGINSTIANGNSFFGRAAGFNNTTGNNNTFFGREAGSSNTTESNNTFIGAYSNVLAGATNATAIGHRAFAILSNSLVLGSINGVNGATESTKVGIGTAGPSNPLHVRASIASSTTPGEYVALIDNGATNSTAGVLALRVGRSSDPGFGNNFLTFFNGNNVIFGQIEGNGNGGVRLVSVGNDYAEWLPRLDPKESILPGDVVGVFDGRISKATRGASQVMVISSSPIVAGNDPGPTGRATHEIVAFIGQAKVRVKGMVQAGDFIVASGQGDGIGKAVSPEKVTAEEFAQVVGQAWEASVDSGVKQVRVAVGLIRHDPTVKRLVTHSQQQDAQIAAMDERLKAIEQTVKPIAGKSNECRSAKVVGSLGKK